MLREFFSKQLHRCLKSKILWSLLCTNMKSLLLTKRILLSICETKTMERRKRKIRTTKNTVIKKDNHFYGELLYCSRFVFDIFFRYVSRIFQNRPIFSNIVQYPSKLFKLLVQISHVWIDIEMSCFLIVSNIVKYGQILST